MNDSIQSSFADKFHVAGEHPYPIFDSEIKLINRRRKIQNNVADPWKPGG